MKQKITYTLVDENGYQSIKSFSLIDAIELGEYCVINGVSYHIYESDRKILRNYKEKLNRMMQYRNTIILNGDMANEFNDSQESAWWD